MNRVDKIFLRYRDKKKLVDMFECVSYPKFLAEHLVILQSTVAMSRKPLIMAPAGSMIAHQGTATSRNFT